MEKESRIYVAGHNGMAGSAILRKLRAEGYTNIITRSSSELDLRTQEDVSDFFKAEAPEYVFLGAAKVGGIYANNTFRAEFLYDNLMIQSNVIHNSYLNGVKKLLFLGSSCIYPRLCPQPIKEEYLLTGPLEYTNEPYAVAKIAGLKLCESYRMQYGADFFTVMPTNLYGPKDNYDKDNSHVFAALVKKFVDATQDNAPSVSVWGTGSPMREFLHVDDLASACVFLMQIDEVFGSINIGFGEDISIANLAKKIGSILSYPGEIIFDKSKPDGTPRKLLDSSKIRNLGWNPMIDLDEGIRLTVEDYKEVQAIES